MSRVLGFVSKSLNRVLGRNNEPKEEEFKKNIQIKEASHGYGVVVNDNIPNDQVSPQRSKVIPK